MCLINISEIGWGTLLLSSIWQSVVLLLLSLLQQTHSHNMARSVLRVICVLNTTFVIGLFDAVQMEIKAHQLLKMTRDEREIGYNDK